MIIPTILERSFEEVSNKIKIIEGVAPLIEIDVVDNTSTSGYTFQDVEKIGKINTKSEITLHLQVENPVHFIKKTFVFIPLIKGKINNVSTVITQMTDKNTVISFLKKCKKIGYKVGVSLKLEESISLIEDVIKDIDLVQFMTAEPGKQGNPFNQEVLEKIKTFKSLYPNIKTQADGGINENTLPLILNSGIDNVVIGSAIFNSENPKQKYLEFSSAYGTNIDN